MSLAAETELDAPADSVPPDTRHLTPDTLSSPDTLPLTIIEPRRGWRSLELAELWRYRHLLWMFMWRNIKAQQKQTVLGILWIFIGPLASVAMMTVVFSRMLNVPSDGFPYPIFLFAGNFLWGQFSGATGGSMNSVVGSANFIQKVYFPRLLIPLSAATGGLINVCIVFPLILVVMLVLGYPPLWTTVFCPLIILMVLATGLGIGLWLAPLQVVYRDVARIAGYGLSLGMYATPVIYPLSVIPERYRLIASFNPMAGYINMFRACLYGGPLYWESSLTAIAFTVIVLVTGAFFYARQSGKFADVI